MSTIKVVSMTGAEVGSVELNDAIFGIEPNMSVVHEVVKNHLANCRQGTQSALTRARFPAAAESPGVRRAPAVARQGNRAPQWTHGGIVFAPKPRDYSYVLNREGQASGSQERALRQGADGEIIVVDKIALAALKTKDFRDSSPPSATARPLSSLPRSTRPSRAPATSPASPDRSCQAHQRATTSAQRQEPRHRQGSPRSHRGGVRVMANAYDIIIRPIITERPWRHGGQEVRL